MTQNACLATWSVIVDDGDGNWYLVATKLSWVTAVGLAIKEIATRNARLLEDTEEAQAFDAYS